MLNPFKKKRARERERGEKTTNNFRLFSRPSYDSKLSTLVILLNRSQNCFSQNFTCQIWKAFRVEHNLTGCTPFDPAGSGPSTNVWNHQEVEAVHCVSCQAPGCPERCSRTWPPRTGAPPPPSTPWSRGSSLSNKFHSLINPDLGLELKNWSGYKMVFCLLQQRSSGAVLASFLNKQK